MDSSGNPWFLVQRHQYNAAVSAYMSRLAMVAGDAGTYAELGTAYLCLGEAPLALTSFRRAEAEARRELPMEMGRTDAYQVWIATALLVEGAMDPAIQELLSTVEGIRTGTTSRSDMAGGATPGLLLYYVAQAVGHLTARTTALQYMTWLLKRRRSENWPGPLMGLFTGRATSDSILETRFGTSDVRDVVELSRDDLSIRRAAASALFYISIYKEEQGDFNGAAEAMRACAGLENPILAVEWYLARTRIVSDPLPPPPLLP